VKVTKVEAPAALVLKDFTYSLVQYTMEKVRQRFVRTATRVFAARSEDKAEWRFHKHQYDKLLAEFTKRGYTLDQLEIIEHPLYPLATSQVKMPESWVAREDQGPIIDYIVEEGHTKVVTLQTGRGKLGDNRTLVKIPGGWKQLGDIRVGEYVIAPDGTHTKVLNVYPHGVSKLHRVLFEDGRFIYAGGEHLWKVLLDDSSEAVIDTNTIGDWLKHNRCYIPFYKGGLLGEDHLDNANYVSTSKAAAIAHQQLVWQAGGVATLKEEDGLWSVTGSVYPDAPGLRIVSIEYSHEAPATCIEVDHPDALYVFENHVVTHNTACALKANERIGTRLLVMVLGRYFDKWKGDLIENYGLKPQELITVRGQKQLHSILEQADNDAIPDNCQAILVTTDTISDYIRLYEQTKFLGMPKYLVPPEDIYKELKVGFRILDECHQNFHANFKIDLYTHIPKALYLSATLESDDPFIDKMYQIAYPLHLRQNGGAYIKYTHVRNIEYQLLERKGLNFKNGKGQYSHIEYEKWIMRKPERLKRYLELIWSVVKHGFIAEYVEGQRCLLLAAQVEMCDAIAKYIDDRVGDLTVSKYTSDEDYEVLMTSDISVSTYGSAGTAVDIANLTVCILTTAVSGSQANLQIIGRLRQLKLWPTLKPKFFYLTCLDVPPHRNYHQKKMELFQHRVLSHTTLPTPMKV
jgi:hypothetical protein